MADADYYQDAAARIRNLMRDTFGDRFKVYYTGMPNDLIPESAYPVCIVHKTAGSISQGATGQDVMQSQIRIHFLLKESDDMNASGDTDQTMRKLQRMIEGRDPVSGQWLSGTAMHALRTNVTIDDTVINTAADVEYEVTPIDDDTTISQGVIEVLTTEKITVYRTN